MLSKSRDEAFDELSKILGADPNKAQVSAYLDMLKGFAEANITEAVKTTKAESETNWTKKLEEELAKKEAEVSKKFEGYKTVEEYNAVFNELNGIKDAQAKQERLAKLTQLGIKKGLLEFADERIGSEQEGYDERVQAFIKENPDFKAGLQQVDYGRNNPSGLTLPTGVSQEMAEQYPWLAKK